jgi:lipopolysaccharide export system protein LptC
MNARSVFGFAMLLLAAAGSWYLTISLREPDADQAPRDAQRDGFYLRSARILGTKPDGDPLYEIAAEYAEQLPNEDIRFQNVRISYSPEATVPWTLNADTAMIGANQERVILSGHVVAASSEGFGGEATEIRTSWLEFHPATYRAETNSHVQILVGPQSLTATGMLALLQENRVHLKSNVSGKFVPETKRATSYESDTSPELHRCCGNVVHGCAGPGPELALANIPRCRRV